MKEFYMKSILAMLKEIDDEKFLNQIRIILKRHIERKESKV